MNVIFLTMLTPPSSVSVLLKPRAGL